MCTATFYRKASYWRICEQFLMFIDKIFYLYLEIHALSLSERERRIWVEKGVCVEG